MTQREQTTTNFVTRTRTTTKSENRFAAAATGGSSYHTEPGVFKRRELEPMELEEIRQAYAEVLGPLNSVKAHDIETAIDAGLDGSAIVDAINETAMARRPSHYYLRAVLRRYMAEGIFTAARAEQLRQQRRRERMAANRRQWDNWYQGPDDLDAFI